MSSNGAVQSTIDPDLREVTERVQRYTDPATTDQLYDFGKMLLQESVDRSHWIDSKAGTVAGFCGALIAFLFSTSSSWKAALAQQPNGLRIAVFGAIVAILIAGALAFAALFNRNFSWIQEKDEWINKDYLDYPDFLRRSYILTMFQSVHSHALRNDTKSACLSLAQLSLLVGGSLLAVPVIVILWRMIWSS